MTGQQDGIFHLDERCLIRISGDDAESFLQNLVTQDVARLEQGKLTYGCLLTPQGRFLHDLFIFKSEDGFFLEIEKPRREDLIRRLKIFRLRAKVAIDEADFSVYAGTPVSKAGYSFADPRLGELGYRSYLPADEVVAIAGPSAAYRDRRIHLGVPEGSADIKPEIDTVSDANLDLLHAVSWDKGCFVGQEVTARMHNRGLIKKRMMIIAGARLVAGDALTQDGHAVGEVRAVNVDCNEALAILKLAALNGDSPVMQADGTPIKARKPLCLEKENP